MWEYQYCYRIYNLFAKAFFCNQIFFLMIIGNVRLTYFGSWDYVAHPLKLKAIRYFYVAPGVLYNLFY